jgi:hypothetical protein
MTMRWHAGYPIAVGGIPEMLAIVPTNTIALFFYKATANGWTPVTGQWVFTTNDAAMRQMMSSLASEPNAQVGAYAWDGDTGLRWVQT